MWEERRGNVRTVTFPCGPLRWTLVNPFGFSHLQEGCRSEGSGQIGKWIGKQQNCSAVIRNTFPCICRAALRLRRLLDDFCFRSAEKCCFRSTSAVSTTTNTSFDQGSLSRISSAVIKAKTQKVTFFLLLFFFFFFLPTFSEARSCDPENEISTPLWKHCLRVTSQLSNRVVKSCALERPRVRWLHFNHRCTRGCIHTAF